MISMLFIREPGFKNEWKQLFLFRIGAVHSISTLALAGRVLTAIVDRAGYDSIEGKNEA